MTLKILLALGLLLLGGCAVIDRKADRREARFEERWPPVGQFLEVDGRRVHALVTGEGPDLVLLHGASGNIRDFTFDFVDRVKDRYRVIVFDRPGLGYTDRAPGTPESIFAARAESPAAQAAFLKKAADLLGVKDEIVLGHSYGGAVALAWGLDHDPAALVVLSGAVIPWSGGLGLQYNVLGSPLGGAMIPPVATAFATRGLIDQTVAEIFKPQPAPEGYVDHVGPGLTLRRETVRANARQLTDLHGHVSAMALRYGSLTLPVEIVHGTEDDVVPDHVHAGPLSELLPNDTLTLLPNVGHMPHHAQPQAVVDAIDRAAARAGLR
ncbi:alpha/beta fold hydrolase [Litorisediminicola beolgyonensis]|uniref:Alpha/beta fold hydrolase n=1 Tax=Litorisediminicola beolgyonensis TaxID=1173614 RepID=A0ABW3ZDV4_9RHOB